MHRIVRHLLLIGAFALLALPTPAFASADQVIRDCAEDGKLDHNYSNAELRRARDNMPSDLDEYSDCRDVIAGAIKGGSDRGGASGSPGIGATDPEGEAAAQANDTAELGALAEGKGGESPRLNVGGQHLEPDDSGYFNLSGAANQLPLPLLVALLLLAALAVASGVGSLRERVPAIARVPLMSKIPSKLPNLRVPFIGRRS